MMNHWLGIALVAYLMGAAIEGASTASQLFHSAPELIKDTQDNPSESATPPSISWRLVAAIASVSICGACCWPCRLLHRSIKGGRKDGEAK
ncbi:hypothetical protein [Cylindrospermum sp. FACHB-282]|uniref:hypothetical protein n=1 Tax=Cylindrospermum sp. FACHB-282 TaxID=2692794 RepID=UPI001685357F|nr:hypothetical protein [Cylindrospermum sp. FACHB-282]MBD2387008.1 hypothetical protein [Cylindrospermum sp. FACHB-282]